MKLPAGISSIFILILCYLTMINPNLQAQKAFPATPDKLLGELFTDVQMQQIFPDGKTFADALPKKNADELLREYRKVKKNPPPDFSLKSFVEAHFTIPVSSPIRIEKQEADVVEHIQSLWPLLKRSADQKEGGGSLLPLPHPYIVPGGRFREVYYWDSYFTMLGLKESGDTKTIEDMVQNFSWMIETYGHIPNGNRSYYLSRSQPPFFSLMVSLLAELKGEAVYGTYLTSLEKEYQYWMKGGDKLQPGESSGRVVRLADGTLMNRYWDDLDQPRQESYREDRETAERAVAFSIGQKVFKTDAQRKKAAEEVEQLTWRNLRSGAASGWDFSSRWFNRPQELASITVVTRIPVDLNCLLYHLESVLKRAYTGKKSGSAAEQAKFLSLAADYDKKAQARRQAIESYCWNEAVGTYADYDFVTRNTQDQIHMAGMFPLFFRIASSQHAARQQQTLAKSLLKAGGFVTTQINSGQQWDAPNGWAPLQWIGIIGLEQYNYFEEARDAATRWVNLNRRVYAKTGRLMEKYNVENMELEAGGGEYPSQDGFGWTNGVLLALIKKYNLQ